MRAADEISWRWCFYINLPVGGFSVVILLLFFRSPKYIRPADASPIEKLLQMDLIGSVLIMGSLISFILAFQWAGLTEPWNSSVTIGLLVGFGVITIAFVIWQITYAQHDRAMIPPRLLKSRQVWSVALFSFFNAGTYFGSIYILPIYFQSVHGVSPIQSGVRNIPYIVALVLGLSIAGYTAATTGIATPWIPLGAVLATIATGLLYTLDADTGMGRWIGYQVLAGFGYGFSFQIPITVVQAIAPEEDLAMITATVLCEL
jgi:MFS family permease